MSKFLRFTAIAVTVAVAFGATAATAVPATADATAKARVLKPLTLSSKQNLDLGTIVLSGAAPFSATVGIDRNGAFTCGAAVTCSSTHQVAIYNVAGTKSQPVTVAAGNVTMSDGAGHTLTLIPDFNSTVNLTNSGAPGTDFNVGGKITVADTTTDGVYTGTFAVTADYQ
jgi:hypothetical protein